LSDLPFFLFMRKSKPYAGRNGEQFGVSETILNYLDGVADDKLREISQRSAEYRAVESAKHSNPIRGVIAATGKWVAPYCSAH
jgi:hypothetical protein